MKNSYNSIAKQTKTKTNNPVRKWAEDLNRHPSKKIYRWPMGM